eukprot:2969587-Pyramimonas_sp.AAC.1
MDSIVCRLRHLPTQSLADLNELHRWLTLFVSRPPSRGARTGSADLGHSAAGARGTLLPLLEQLPHPPRHPHVRGHPHAVRGAGGQQTVPRGPALEVRAVHPPGARLLVHRSQADPHRP